VESPFLSPGELPSDELLQDLQSFLTPFGDPPQKVTVPKDLREAVSQLVQPSLSAMSDSGVLAVLNQAVHSFEQIPKLVDEVCIRKTRTFIVPGDLTLTMLDPMDVTGGSWGEGFRTDAVSDTSRNPKSLSSKTDVDCGICRRLH
jgi:hypothetical protein